MRLTFGKALVMAIPALAPATALAYIDPGTGSVLIQGIIATVAAVGVTLRLYWHKVTSIFRRRKAEDIEPADVVEPKVDREEQL